MFSPRREINQSPLHQVRGRRIWVDGLQSKNGGSLGWIELARVRVNGLLTFGEYDRAMKTPMREVFMALIRDQELHVPGIGTARGVIAVLLLATIAVLLANRLL
jgi:hypothetical protein